MKCGTQWRYFAQRALDQAVSSAALRGRRARGAVLRAGASLACVGTLAGAVVGPPVVPALALLAALLRAGAFLAAVRGAFLAAGGADSACAWFWVAGGALA